jgi:hypothetical protein
MRQVSTMDMPIDPPLLVKDTPKPRPLRSLADARAFVDVELRVGRPPPWRELQHRLETVSDQEDAVEAIGALRELLETEELLVQPKQGFVEEPRD